MKPLSNSKLPFIIDPPTSSGLDLWFQQGRVINPSFPNWDRSFVSGHKSPLFKVEHREFEHLPGWMATQVSFLPICEGPPGNVHGGATAGLLDEVLGVAVWHDKHLCVTQTLTLHYGRTLPLDQKAYVITQIKSVSEKTVMVECTVFDKERAPYVSAQGAFHRLTLDQLQMFNELKNKA